MDRGMPSGASDKAPAKSGVASLLAVLTWSTFRSMDELSFTEAEIRAAAIAAFPVPEDTANAVYINAPVVAAMLIDALRQRMERP